MVALSFIFLLAEVPVGIAACAAATTGCTFALRNRRSILLGGVSLLLTVYSVLGILNFSAKRGYMIPEVQALFFMGLETILSVLFMTCLLMGRENGATRVAPELSGNSPALVWRPGIIFMLLVPSVLAVPFVLYDRGFDVLTESRYGTDPLVHLGILLVFIPLALSIHNLRVYRDEKLNAAGYYVVLIWALICFLILGYRNAIVGAIIMFVIINSNAVSLRKLAPYGGAVLVLVLSVEAYRRASSSVLLDISTLQAEYNAADMPEVLASLHFIFREGFGISHALIMQNRASLDPIFFADLLTLLPGEQPSGGRIIAELAGGSLQEGGLNAGLIGLSFFEFGVGVGGLFFLGAVSAFFATMMCWRVVDDRRSEALLVAISTYEFLLLFHRGDMRAYSYFLIAGIIFIVRFRNSPNLRVPLRVQSRPKLRRRRHTAREPFSATQNLSSFGPRRLS